MHAAFAVLVALGAGLTFAQEPPQEAPTSSPATTPETTPSPETPPPTCAPRSTWPTPQWTQATPAPTPAFTSAKAAFESYAFTLLGDDAARLGVRTDSVVVIKGGVVVYERYARGFGPHNKHLAWSVTKSLMHAATGVAVREGLLSPSDSICKAITGLRRHDCLITVDHLMMMASGRDWSEGYEDGETRQDSSVLAALYGQGYRDIARFNARHPSRAEPGESFRYSSGDTATLSLMLKTAMQERFTTDFLWPAVFEPLGATEVTVEEDQAGTVVGGSYWYVTPRDAARLGYLYLNDGCWKNERLLPEGWVQDAVVPNSAFLKKRVGAKPHDVYGRLWWLNRAVPALGIEQPYKDIPPDTYAASGHWGQSITVVPSKDLVIVRFADDRDGESYSFNTFHQLAIAMADAAELP
jgi:CubicO group peptidase (beta-lactamase class C family)